MYLELQQLFSKYLSHQDSSKFRFWELIEVSFVAEAGL